MEIPFSEEEIGGELRDTDGNKADDPDGFTFKLVQLFWPELKGKPLYLFNHFFETTDFDHRFLSSVECLNDFRKTQGGYWEVSPGYSFCLYQR